MTKEKIMKAAKTLTAMAIIAFTLVSVAPFSKGRVSILGDKDIGVIAYGAVVNQEAE